MASDAHFRFNIAVEIEHVNYENTYRLSLKCIHEVYETQHIVHMHVSGYIPSLPITHRGCMFVSGSSGSSEKTQKTFLFVRRKHKTQMCLEQGKGLFRLL
jgi:hypothetical protein